MKLCFNFPAFLKTILAVVFVVAGGVFSHSFADMPHVHVHEATVSGGQSHEHASSDEGQLVADHETVHCGAYLLALTPDDQLIVPEFQKEALGISIATAVSRVGKLDPPPPRPEFLSI